MGRVFVLAFAPQSPTEPSVLQKRYAISIEASKTGRLFRLSAGQAIIFDSHNTTASPQSTPNNSGSNKPSVKVLIAQSKQQLTPTTIKSILQQTQPSITEEAWLESRLASLQTAGILDHFSPSKFRRWLDDALESHVTARNVDTLELDYASMLKSSIDTKAMLDREPPAYAEVEPTHEKTFWGFRVSSPHPRSGRLPGFDVSRDVYGGLM